MRFTALGQERRVEGFAAGLTAGFAAYGAFTAELWDDRDDLRAEKS